MYGTRPRRRRITRSSDITRMSRGGSFRLIRVAPGRLTLRTLEAGIGTGTREGIPSTATTREELVGRWWDLRILHPGATRGGSIRNTACSLPVPRARVHGRLRGRTGGRWRE